RLHPSDIEVLLRMGQQVGSMRWNGSTAVVLRVDEWPQLRGCLLHRVEIESHLAQEVQSGAEAGRRDSSVDLQRHRSIGCGACDVEPIGGVECGDGHRRVYLKLAGFDEVAQPRPERTASGQTVLIAATVDAGRIGTTNDPTDPSAGLFITQLSQRQQSVC